ncbi:heterokaryon incompatibility domain-containing protein [Trichoderma pleuroticola]
MEQWFEQEPTIWHLGYSTSAIFVFSGFETIDSVLLGRKIFGWIKEKAPNPLIDDDERSPKLQPRQWTLELSRSARESGCLCCAILWQLIDKSLLGELHDAEISILSSAGYFTNDSVTQNWMFALQNRWEEAVRVVAKKHRWMYHPLRDTLSDKCLSWVKEQLDKCVKHHGQCAAATRDFIGVVLCNGIDTPAGSPHVALSHCWGPNGRTEIKCRTVSGNLSSQFHRIPRSLLSQTFQDIVDFTRRLGMQFLWEAPRMFDVYHNTRLTLAAHDARSSLEGLYSKSTPEREIHITLPPKVAHEMMKRDGSGMQGVRIEMFGLQMDLICPFRSNAKDNSELLSFEAPLKNSERDHYDSGPLFTRTWSIQERLVSPRVLVCKANDLAWECNMMLTCECKRIEMESSIKSDYSKVLEGTSSKFHKKKQVTAREELWWNLVERYSWLGITNATDKLPAVAVIAKQLHMTSRQHWTYYAGLWSGSLFQDMIWVSDIQDYQNRATRPKNLDPVKFLGSTYDVKPSVKPVAKFIEIECRNSDGEAFMQPDKSTCFFTLLGETSCGRAIAYNRKTDEDANLDAHADPDEDFSASEAADNDFKDNDFSSPVYGAGMDVELIEVADLTYKRGITIHKKDRHQAVFIILKGKGFDDDRRYERLGFVKVSYYTDENFITAFREAALKRLTRNCVIV